MKSLKQIFTLFGGSALAQGGAQGASLQRADAPVMNHMALALQVEEAIAADPELRTAQIDVEVFVRVVQLSGFVDSPAHMSRAVLVASDVEGVESVRNCMRLAWW